MAEKFPSCKDLIDWGRDFIENDVLPELKSKNDKYLAKDQPTTYYLWIHRDAPQINKEALAASNESAVMKAYYVGEVRAKQMKNAAYAALFEYLLG